MNKTYLIAAFGPDKTGLVNSLTKIILEHNYSIADSRMSILGDHFSILMLISGSKDNADKLKLELKKIGSLKITIENVNKRKIPHDIINYSIRVTGGDTVGIVHEVAHYLTANNVNIVTMETSVSNAPHSGTEVFNLSLIAEVPQDLHLRDFKDGLLDKCEDLNLDVDIKAN